MGMFSLLDAVLDKPMEEVLAEVPLAPDLRDALLGKPGAPPALCSALALARAVETADWAAVEQGAAAAGITLADVSERYLDSAGWADTVFSA